jgi:hypothetical protein
LLVDSQELVTLDSQEELVMPDSQELVMPVDLAQEVLVQAHSEVLEPLAVLVPVLEPVVELAAFLAHPPLAVV